MATANPLPEQLIYLIIRFTASVPDLPLSINAPRTITTLSLKQLIREYLPPNHAPARLRLIYAGKVLADTEPLAKSLRIPQPPPRRDGPYNEDGPGSKSKGKQPLRDTPAAEYGTTTEPPSDAKKYYIHCSLGDALSPAELSQEATLAQTTEDSLKSQYESSQTSSQRRESKSSINDVRRRSSTATAPQPQPQGFDRLLSSGFTPQEVASLRSHFQTNLSFTHTPDTMPSPAEMRVLEDRWLDSTATDPSPALTGEGGDTGWGAGFAVEDGGLDDMLWGYMTGFFWPLGALVWGFREEGVWSRRRQLAVVMGVLINTIFGFMRWSA
ncbi:hypothetical protein HBI24_211560 [Parastagonospora nodorum]|nr:hypothetical protein HBI09_188870 [Parastagonospora nodorum]KAH4061592.1 hypothetical protein HBH50_218060 [Parastagonospora nodorum]KAH4080150.1 hypothetical protein HBH48_212390 [Parastagonospora nodorum]KAH4156482.1 hypothetical protein HBH43_208270 [Parastagonospora nodorum]KAH4252503.1 hypothetical protein HBI03_210080 [Parastagonospora nodorum]